MTPGRSLYDRDLHQAGWAQGYAEGKAEQAAEVERMRELARRVLDALDAEKTPDFGVGHDRAVEAALAMLGQKQKPIEGRSVPLSEL